MAKNKKRGGNAKSAGDDKKYQKHRTSHGNAFSSKMKQNGKNHEDRFDDYKLRQLIQGSNSEREIVEMEADGNCLFRSLSHQLHRDFGQRHDTIRHEICNFLEENKEEFRIFLLMDDEEEDVRDFDSYVSEMRKDGTWGGDVEIVCAARLYRRNVTIFSSSGVYNIGIGEQKPLGPNFLLSYHENSHYNSVHDHNQTCVMPSTDPFHDEQQVGSTHERQHHGESFDGKALSSSTAQDNVQDVKRTKKNDSCPCGSNLRYKKCCFATDKSRMRAEKFKMKNQRHDLESNLETDTMRMREFENSFQILNI